MPELDVSGEEYVTLPAASRSTGVPVKRIRRAVQRGGVPAFDLDSAWPRVRLRDVIAWIESTRVRPTEHARRRVEEVLEREARAAP